MKHGLLIAFLCIVATGHAQPYWQQQVDTKISVQLDDVNNMLNGYEELVYTNNSPDTLRYIYMHLWPNGYKNDRTPFARQQELLRQTAFYYAKPADRGYIDSLKFEADGQSVDYYSAENVPDIARIDLVRPLLPGAQLRMTTPFRVKVPKVFSRLGHTGQAYFISQWFPKPAVYDQKGWHPIPFLDQGEFYSNYGSYDVSITLPKNYIVMATGNCSDEGENTWLDELAKKALPSDTLYNNSYPASDAVMKTLHYHEDKVHDFAWFADKRWVVRKDTVSSPGSGQLVTAWAAFLPNGRDKWIKATDYLRQTVLHYGGWVGPYPYKTIKAVEGDMKAGGGMEYPTVTIIDRAATAELKSVVVHEAGHNWFYGILGTNERDHAWMDEGINTFYEQKTTKDLAKDTTEKKIKGFTADLSNVAYYMQAAVRSSQAIDQTSANFTQLNYGTDVYYKTALVLNWLQDYMGTAAFESGMHEYYDTWKFKHPYPEDFAAIMQKHTDKPIGWFFDDVLKKDTRIDFAIKKAHTNNDKVTITVKNNSGLYSPVQVDAYHDDSLVSSVWSAPFIGKATLTLPAGNWTSLRVDKDVPDYKLENNIYRRYGDHKFTLRIRPAGINYDYRNKLYVLPALGYNQYDGFQLGLLLHDLSIPANRFRFALAPMYAFNSKSFTGAGSVGYIWYPGGGIKEILLQGDAKSFHYDETYVNTPGGLYARYVKVAPSLTLTFREPSPQSTVTRTLMLKGYYINEDNFVYGLDSLRDAKIYKLQHNYGLMRYIHANKRLYNPFSYSAEGQLGADFAKISAEGNLRINYFSRNKSLYVRGYVGKFFAINSDPIITQRYYLNSTYTGANDYLYDGAYFGRSTQSGLAAQQVSINEGGFKIPTQNNIGRSDDYLAAINVKSDLPLGRLPIRLFADAGISPNSTPTFTNSSDTKFLYDLGVELHLPKDIITFNIPVLMSGDFQNYLKDTYGNKNQFVRSLSFTVKLQNVNWLKTASDIQNFLR